MPLSSELGGSSGEECGIGAVPGRPRVNGHEGIESARPGGGPLLASWQILRANRILKMSAGRRKLEEGEFDVAVQTRADVILAVMDCQRE